MRGIVKSVVVLIVMCIVACQPKPLKIEVDQLQAQLVLNAQVIPDQVMIVSLTRSFGALSYSEENGDTTTNTFLDTLLVSGATVKINYNGQTDSLIEVSPGLYIGVTAPHIIDGVYTITCEDHERNLSCSASATILPQIQFEELIPKLVRNETDTFVKMNLKFIDPDEPNYYMINVYKNSEEDEVFGDVNSFFGNGSNLLLLSDVFSDVTFNKDTVEGTMNLRRVEEGDSIVVTLSNISREYFDYLELGNKSGNLFAQITQEPINYNSNVLGGYGFFNTHIPDIRFFLLNNLEVISE